MFHRCELRRSGSGFVPSRAAILAAGLVAVLAAACGPAAPDGPNGLARRIVSLDYCADQYVLGLVERSRILALSPDAGEAFSYLRAQAGGLPTVRPRAEDVLILRPDLVVRTYGGGPRAGGFFEQAGIPVLQIDYAPDIASVRAGIRRAAARLDAGARGEALIAEMDARIERARARGSRARALYLTPAGVSAGSGTLVHDLIEAAGIDNFDERNGWRSIPLERLAYEAPDVYAVPSFGATNHRNAWTPFRHSVATERVAAGPAVPIDGSTTACGGWFLADAVEALAEGGVGAAGGAEGGAPVPRP